MVKRFSLILVLVLAFFVVPDTRAQEGGNPSAFVTMKLPMTQAVQALAGKLVGFDIVGDVIPIVTKPDELTITDMSPFNTWLRNPFRSLQPFTLKNNSVPYTTQNRESAKYCASLTIDSPYTGKKVVYETTEPNTTQISGNIPWTQDFFTYGQHMASTALGTFRMQANEEGKLVYDKKEKIMSGISIEDCGKNDLSVEHEQASVGVSNHAVFGQEASVQLPILKTVTKTIFDSVNGILTQVFDKVDIKMELLVTKKDMLSNSHFNSLNAYGSNPTRDITEEITNHSRTPKDGWPASLIAFSQRKTAVGWGGSKNSIDVGGDASRPMNFVNPETGVNRAYESLKDANCPITASYFLKNNLRKIGGKIPVDTCSPPKEEALCSSTEFPNLSSNSCKLCNSQAAKTIPGPFPGTLPDGIPPALQAILEKTGEAFSVPPASILAVMYHEGAFTRSWFTGDNAWTEENVKKWGVCGGTMPISDGQLCDPKTVDYATCGSGGSGSGACATSIAGFGWLPVYFWQGDGDTANWTAVQKIDPARRTKEMISPCNVLDAAAATAKALSRGSAYVPPAVTSSSCFSTNMTNTSIPGSCTAWNDNTVLQSHVSYAGYCPEPGKNGQYPPNAAYKDMVLGWYNAFKCGQ